MDGAMVPIGEAALEAIEEVSSELRGRIRERFQPYEGVYRLNDCGCSPATASTPGARWRA